jgi:hypothetical protein
MKNMYLLIIGIIVVAGGAFFGGMMFQKSQDSLSGLTGEELTSKLESLGSSSGTGMGFPGGTNAPQFGTNGTGGPGGMPTNMPSGRTGNGGNMTSGEIISADDESVTIKEQDGSTSVVYFSSSTAINKTVDGTSSDLTDGTNIMVSGTSNSDGSVTATTIEIRTDDSVQPPTQ